MFSGNYSHSSVFCVTLLVLLGSFPSIVHQELLHGTTILNWPYVNQRPNGQFEGFCIDLLNELAPLMGMVYTLRLVSDGQYGGWVLKNGSINGMIQEVVQNEADFAIGDITVLSTRARFVDFTLSFMDFGLSALVRREVWQGSNIRSFKDLSEQTEIAYGVKRYGAHLPLFHDSAIVKRMYSYMDTHPSVFVDGERAGLQKAKSERYAFITESPFVEYVVQRDCDLMAIDDRRKNFQFEYAIAVAKNSPLKDRFNKAIRQLRSTGRIKELKNKYWLSSNCVDSNNNGNFNQSTNAIQFSDRYQEKDRLKANKFGDLIEPHDDIDEEEVEYIKPKEQDINRGRRRRKKPGQRNGSHKTRLISNYRNFLSILFTITFLMIF